MRRYKALVIHRGGRVTLLDVEIPACSKASSRGTGSSLHFLNTICPPRGRDRSAVTVLIPADTDCGVGTDQVVNLAARLMRKGAARRKRRARGGLGADKGAKTVLAAGNAVAIPAPSATPPEQAAPVPFQGGEMIFYPDRVELCGVKIVGDTGTGQSRMILDLLKRKRDAARYVYMSGEALAKSIGAVGIGVVTGCIRTIRRNATERLMEILGVRVGNEDVIVNDGVHGYCLKEWITVRDETNQAAAAPSPAGRDADDAGGGAEPDRDTGEPDEGARDTDGGEPDADRPAHDSDAGGDRRRQRILELLQANQGLQAPSIAARMRCSLATAKREMAALRKAGVVEFVGHARTGHYRLVGGARPELTMRALGSV
jgi:hypothetical protein